MKTCCGQQIRTPFCPYCGRVSYNANGLERLLSHIQNHVKAFEKRAKQIRIRFKDTPEIAEEKVNHWCGLPTQKRWKEWEEALIKAMEDGKEWEEEG